MRCSSQPDASPDDRAIGDQPLSILMVEDDDLDAALLSETIQQIGSRTFEIRRAASLQEAHTRLESKDIDAILLDLSLPDASGLEAIESLASAKLDCPIIVLTGLEDEALGQMLIRLGAQDYLPKGELTRATIWRSISHAMERFALARKLVEAESRALSASSAKSDFVAMVSHEIRTPMHSILGTADLLSETLLDAQQKEYVDAFQRSGKTLLSLINNVLDLATIEGGAIIPSVQAFDPVELLKEALAEFSIPIEAKGVRLLAFKGEGVPSRCVGDADHLRQILSNLIGNAWKFTDVGEIRAILDIAPNGRLRIAVEDTGCGIASGQYEPLFEPFRQGGGGNHRHLGGAGLGLPICKSLVEMMGGAISASARLGGGSRFEFDFEVQWEANGLDGVAPDPADLKPIDLSASSLSDPSSCSGKMESEASEVAVSGDKATANAVKESQLGPAGQSAGQESETIRILLVDDSEDNRMLATAYLSGVDAEIDIAVNGAEAIRQFSDSGPYSIILMDMQMPLIDGYEATREIRRVERESGASPTPIVAITADAFAEQEREARRAGCDEHLAKPITRASLVAAVERWADRSKPEAQDPLQDPLIADLVPGFVARRFEDLEQLDRALAAEQFEEIRRVAHKMKGSGLSFGFPRISVLGAELEQAAIAQDARDVACGIDQIREELEAFSSSV